jgi:hypothetical protein
MNSFSGSLSPLYLESIVKESSIQKYHNDIPLHSEDFQESTCLVLPDLVKATITCIQKSFPYGLKGNQFENEKCLVDYWKYIVSF